MKSSKIGKLKKKTKSEDRKLEINGKRNRKLRILGNTTLIVIFIVVTIFLASIAFPTAMEPIYFEGLTDSDGDGYTDDVDEFPHDSTEHLDSDNDGYGNNQDEYPNNSSCFRDSDDDGYSDSCDKFPMDPAVWKDTDGDSVGDEEDAFPNDPDEWVDSDGDGYGDNEDIFPYNADVHNDSDSDGVGDKEDAFPENPDEWNDSDGDGYGDNEDVFPMDQKVHIDTDGDGYGDKEDAFPENPDEWNDSDGDGFGDNEDEFPLNPEEQRDYDGDGVGDNSDDFFDDETEWIDSDDDGYGDNEDVFPQDHSEWNDSDGDGFGDNKDSAPMDPNRWDYRRTYNFTFDEKDYTLEAIISCEYYHPPSYWESNRNFDEPEELKGFFRADGVISRISEDLNEMAEVEGYKGEQKLNFILRFVQSMEYKTDPGYGDLAKYPADTLIDKAGDCEDTSILYAAITERMGFDSAILTLVDYDGLMNHAMAAVNHNGLSGWYEISNDTRYYVAETTGTGYNVGMMPEPCENHFITVFEIDMFDDR